MADFRVTDGDVISDHRNLLEVLHLSLLEASWKCGFWLKVLISLPEASRARGGRGEIHWWEEMVHDCSLDFGSYCMRPDVMGCEERVGRDGLSFDSDDGGERVAAGDGEGCDSSNDPFTATRAVVELTMGATGAEEKGVVSNGSDLAAPVAIIHTSTFLSNSYNCYDTRLHFLPQQQIKSVYRCPLRLI
ncbi:hypothetical protein B296_00036191 [Ensete ventricosum]|uniref:Uncharacterized protein n=1 Tax=Ensete ventricosum TaxID=4639 RepID=A0A426Y351_ENSVE|nr:hypothetical protein B296_00036191 [Ensete ventricosum]